MTEQFAWSNNPLPRNLPKERRIGVSIIATKKCGGGWWDWGWGSDYPHRNGGFDRIRGSVFRKRVGLVFHWWHFLLTLLSLVKSQFHIYPSHFSCIFLSLLIYSNAMFQFMRFAYLHHFYQFCLCFAERTCFFCVSQEGLSFFEFNQQIWDFCKWAIFEKQRCVRPVE